MPGTGQEEEEKPGFFSRLFTFGGGREQPSQLLWIEVQNTDDGVVDVRVEPVQPAPAGAAEAAGELLRLIRNTLA